MIQSLSISKDNSNFAYSLNNSFNVYSTNPIARRFQKEFNLFSIDQVATSSDGTYIAFVVSNDIKSDSPNSSRPQSPQNTQKPVKSAFASIFSSSNQPTAQSEESKIIKIYIWNNFYGECHYKIEIENQDDNERVLSIKLIGAFLLVVFEKKTWVFDINTKLWIIQAETSPNLTGAGDISISSNDEETKVVASCSSEPGKIDIYRCGSSQKPTKISIFAAKHSVTLMKFSPDSNLIATASEKGTLIRVFDSNNGSPLSIFRRGILSPASVLDICFSPNNSDLIAISSNATVHLFQSDVRNAAQNDYPRSVEKVSIEKCAFAQCSFENQNELFVVASNGIFYTITVTEQNTMTITNKVSFLAK